MKYDCVLLKLCFKGHWDSMEEYTCMIPRDTYDGAFYRAVLALHDDQFPLAQQCIEKARDILDTDLTAMAGESYNRAYGVRTCTTYEY